MISKDDLKNIKLIVFDLDGTLLNNDGEIGEETIELVKRLSLYDVRFSFASKRLFTSVEEYAAKLNINSPLICLDGALIQKYPERTVLYESFVPERYVKKAIELSDRFLLNIALCQTEAIYYTEYNQAIPQILRSYGAIFTEINSYDNYTGNTLEVILTSDQKDAVKYVKNKLSLPFGFGLDINLFKSISQDGQYYLELRKSGSSKGKGLKRLMKYLKLKVNNTAVICDWYNDISLFETGALKIAVANAVPEIKRMAQYVTKRTNNEDGTAEFLELVLRAKKGK